MVRWVGSLSIWDGKTANVFKRKHFYAATAAEVREQLLKARSDQSRGLPVAVERQTVEQFLEHWLEHTLKTRAKPRSYESFSTIVKKHINPVIGRISARQADSAASAVSARRLHKATPTLQGEIEERKRNPTIGTLTADDNQYPNRTPKRIGAGSEMESGCAQRSRPRRCSSYRPQEDRATGS